MNRDDMKTNTDNMATIETKNVLMVRIYVTEASHMLNNVADYLKNKAQIRGFTIFRAIRGFGETGTHTSGLIDFTLDLPIVIEFFDCKEKVETALEYLHSIIKHKHIVFWEAKTNV